MYFRSLGFTILNLTSTPLCILNNRQHCGNSVFDLPRYRIFKIVFNFIFQDEKRLQPLCSESEKFKREGMIEATGYCSYSLLVTFGA